MQLLQIPSLIPDMPADSVGGFSVIEALNKLSHMGYGEIKSIAIMMSRDVLHFLANLVMAIVIYYIGSWLIKRISHISKVAMERRGVEISVRTFCYGLIRGVLYILLGVTIVQVLGVNTASLVTMLASVGLAIGMALSGTLQNFAGGVMILLLKPYRVGDYITSQGESGIVKQIMLFTTVLETYDRHTIFVPNSSISSSIIDNASFADTRRVEWAVGICYGASVAKAREILMEVMREDARIFQVDDPKKKTFVGVSSLGDSSVNLVARGWVNTADYWDVYYSVYERIYERLPEGGIEFPFPQLDVHVNEVKSN